MDIKSAVYQIPSNDFLCRFCILRFAAIHNEALPLLGELCLFFCSSSRPADIALLQRLSHRPLYTSQQRKSDLRSEAAAQSYQTRNVLIAPLCHCTQKQPWCCRFLAKKVVNLFNISGSLQRQRSLQAFQIICSQPILHTGLELLLLLRFSSRAQRTQPF